MYAPNVERVLASLGSSDVVLDIGGWACPFNRANHVVDAEPYETRGYYKTVGLPASQGGDTEYFTADTWHRQDICADPLPFGDKEVDFVICSHVLEDIRDPLWVCSEMVRVAKRGYIEVPSRVAETCRGWESDRIAGLSHHRWLIDIDEAAGEVRFTQKYHMIHSDRRYNLPPSFLHRLSDESKVSWLFWENEFQFSEAHIHGLENIAAELELFARRLHRDAALVRAGCTVGRQFTRLAKRVTRRVTG